MMSSTKNSNDKTCVGFHEVPPPLSHNYSFLPNEHELTGCVSTAPSSPSLKQNDTSVNDDIKHGKRKGNVLKNKNSHHKKQKHIYVVKGSETLVAEPKKYVVPAKRKHTEQYQHSSSCLSSLHEGSGVK